MKKQGSVENRKVSFHGTVDVQEIPSCTQFSTKLIEQCWYSRSELTSLTPRDPKRSGRCCRGECLRGLEGQTTLGSYLRRQQYQRSMYAVIDEQQLQRRARNIDSNALAVVYSRHTTQSREDAYNVALIDEMYVRRHVYELPCSNSDILSAEQDLKCSDTTKIMCTCIKTASSAFPLKRRKSESRLSTVSLRRKLRKFCSNRGLTKVADADTLSS